MIPALLPENEIERLAKLGELDILDTLEEVAYDDLTQLAAEICGTPIALVSLVDRNRQWFKSHHGLDALETPREIAFCAHAILDSKLFVVEDALKDDRFHDNPLTTGAPNVRFYAGAPLIMEGGLNLGTLCVIDSQPHQLSSAQATSLNALARQVTRLLDLRLKVKELKRLDHAKNEFIAMVNHELRTPLTSIQGALGLLKNGTDIPLEQGRDLTHIAYRNSERLLAIINDILDIAKLEAGKLEIQREPMSLVELLTNAVELNQGYFEHCECQPSLDLPDDKGPVMVWGDEKRLMQVMYNLISNAAKFSKPGGRVTVFLKVSKDMASVGVTDHGAGIPLNQQKDIFRKFKQLSTDGSRKHPGTGLGLIICKLILEMHKTDIVFESIPDVQTTFSFGLPLHQVDSLAPFG